MVYFKDLNFFLYFSDLFAINQLFNIHYRTSVPFGVGLSASIFTDPWSFLLLRFLPFVRFNFFYIYVLNRTQFTPLQIPPYNALPFIYFISINPIISVHIHFLQYSLYSVYSIVSYSISCNSFHIYFHILPCLGVN